MADLFGLLQDLGERIASKGDSCSSSTQQLDDDEDPLEARFRSVLPNLLHTYFVPSKVKEREFTAILKLLCHTAKNFPGVFYRGKASAVLPILSHVFPFFTEPAVSGRFGVVFETVGSLISLLKTGDRDIYRHLFIDATLLLEDLVSVASFFEVPTLTIHDTTIFVKCFGGAYSMVELDTKQSFCEVPSHWKPDDSPGLLLSITGKACWEPLAEWTIKLVCRIIVEGALHVEGLITTTFISAIGYLICFGESSLQKECFELLCKVVPIVDTEMVPAEKLILTMTTILSMDKASSKAFRNAAYDSALGSCLTALFMSLNKETVESTSHNVMEVLLPTVRNTDSQELKAAMCLAFESIIKICPSVTWKLDDLLQLFFVSDIRFHVCKCMEYILDALELMKGEPKFIGAACNDLKEEQGKVSVSLGKQDSDMSENIEKKRKGESNLDGTGKRQKTIQDGTVGSKDGFNQGQCCTLFEVLYEPACNLKSDLASVFEEQKRVCASLLHVQLMHTISVLQPAASQSAKLDLQSVFSAFQVLAHVLQNHHDTLYYQELAKQTELWLPLINCKAHAGCLSVSHLAMFLEGLEKLLVNADVEKTFQRTETAMELLGVLELPWSSFFSVQDIDLQKAKCSAVIIASALRSDRVDSMLVYGHASKDEDAYIRSKAVLSMAVPTFSCGNRTHTQIFQILGVSCLDHSSQVREAVAQILGQMACTGRSKKTREPALRMDRIKELNQSSADEACLICPACGLDEVEDAKNDKIPRHEWIKDDGLVGIWQSCFRHLLFEESTQQVQITFVLSMSSILTHATQVDVFKLRAEWLKCLDFLPLHPHRALRKAFSLQISCFLYLHVLEGLFGDDVACSDSATKELQVLGKLKHALSITEDPDVLETLLEMVAAIVLTASSRQQLFFFSFVLLLEQLDSKYASVQATSICLLQKCITVSVKIRGSSGVKLMLEVIQPELFVYLSGRLVSRPYIVWSFADAVLGVQAGDLLRQIVPIVLPKLVIQQQHSTEALNILNALSKDLGTDLPLLLLEWCHKVLSDLLLKADGKDLMAALQFYEAQTGSDTREILSAVLPALLDELVQFIGDTSTEDASRRSARVPLMIQEVACIVSGSDELPAFLKTHFVGLLNSIDRKMLKAKDIVAQKQGLRCIDQLMEMIGCHLTAFVPKIMVLLTRALQEPALQFEGLQVWLAFIRKLADVSPANLKGVASQIVVAVMPCLEGQQVESHDRLLGAIANLLEELVIQNRHILDNQVGELPLLPTLPELENVNSILQEARGVSSLCDQIQRAAEAVRHESISVRLMASSELKKLMMSKRKDVMPVLLGESRPNVSVLSHLVMSLLQGCIEESRSVTSEKFKLFCAECLGELGAIDPVKLNLKFQGRSKIERSDDDLVFELIANHLVRVLRAASETDIQDAAALAIQELLKLCGCRSAVLGPSHTVASKLNYENNCEKLSMKMSSEASSSERGEKLWSRFSEDIRDIITPCLTSKYLLKNATAPIPSGSIFRPGMSFRRWMYLWVRRLVLLTTGPRSLIFNACKGILRHDMATVLYLLPYIVLNVVCDGSSEARASVTDEILAVLAEAASEGDENTEVKQSAEVSSSNGGRSWVGPSEVSIQAVFSLLDSLAQWLDESKQDAALVQQQAEAAGSQKGKHKKSKPIGGPDRVSVHKLSQHSHVSQLLEAIPKTALAGASFRCQAYARALLYYETYVRNKSGALNPAAEKSGTFEDDDISFLLGVYSGLDEPDGLSGLSKLHKSLSLQDEVLINEKAGNWAEALTCCEQALQMDPSSVTRHEGVLNCLLNMGHLQAMVTHVDGLLLRFPEKRKDWSMWGVQAAWRLGQWTLLDEYLQGAVGEEGKAAIIDSNDVFDISLARILLALQKRDSLSFSKAIIQCRHALLAPLAAASMESYSRAYPLIIKLHMLHELEIFHELSMEGVEAETGAAINLANKLQEMMNGWEDRIKVTQPSLWAREPILALRRLMLTSSNLQVESGKSWLQYAKLCRAAGHYETASRAILEAQSAGAPNAHIELAKLFWGTKKSHRAIAELQQALAKASVDVLGAARKAALGGLLHLPEQEPFHVSESQKNDNLDFAKSLLLLARWVHSTGQKQKEDVLSMFTRVKELQPKWEKSYFYLAKYCDDVLADARKRQEEIQEQSMKQQNSTATSKSRVIDDQPWWTLLSDVILFYAKGLHKGHRRLFQALPRLLTLWFEFGSIYFGEALSSNGAVKAVNARVMSIMRGCLKDLPTYQWLTALPQLVSRICHQNEEVVRLVKHIIISVLQAYPQQSLWTMAAVSKSTVAERRSAAAEILKIAKNSLRQEADKVLFSQFTELIDQLIRLCFHGGSSKARSLSLSNEFGTLKRMMPVGVIMPVQRALTVTLPADGLTDMSYNPFSTGDFSTISGIAEEVEILASLQKPKKVIFYGSDGSEHPFLCKPKDDLRKDARMMEFTTTINRMLSKDPRSRRRKLYIRTFAVIPLTEDCGMVEWVPHTRGLRHILQDIYVSCGKFDRQKTNPTIKHIYDQNQGKKSEVETFQTQILPLFPPVFHRWFLNTFSEPANWFQSRVAYAHTTAVWSMVGHIVGLGDRHGENILFDSTTGDCVHVDFSCLFDKGLQLEKPELVPFRLTQNMVDGLGITGYEGVFSRVCEITLSVLRANRETLMSVLETFIHDPLVEWTKSHKSSGIEVKNPHAQRALSNIKARLQGVVVGVGAAPSLPLSVEGQAHQLIAESVSHENLGRMYIWWMPWF